jgi:hypothetical protein
MKNIRAAVVAVVLLGMGIFAGAVLMTQPKPCDTSLQKMAGMSYCDDAAANAIIKQRTAARRVLNSLDDRATCAQLGGEWKDNACHTR